MDLLYITFSFTFSGGFLFSSRSPCMHAPDCRVRPTFDQAT